MNMAGLGGWRGLSRALKCFGVRGFLRRVRQDHKVARCMAHALVRARKVKVLGPGSVILEDSQLSLRILGYVNQIAQFFAESEIVS